MNIFETYSRQQQAEPSPSRDWDYEQIAEARYREEEYRNQPEPSTAWEDYQANWVEITEFVGIKKPMGRSLQMNLFDEVA